MSQNLIVMLLCAAVLIILLAKEIRRPNKANLILRIAATALSVACLALFIIPFRFKASKDSARSAVLLTSNFDRDSVSDYLRNSKDSVPVFFIDESLSNENKKIGKFYPGISYFLSKNPEINRIELYGNRLRDSEYQELGALPVEYHPNQRQVGFEAANWRRELKQGEGFSISGIFNNGGNTAIKLILKALHTTIDSVAISPKRKETFSLSASPKQIGLVTWHMLAISGKDTISDNPIPFKIKTPEKINVLMLFSSPGFESRFLKNWLEENGYGVAVKTIISKNKSSRLYSNLTVAKYDHLSQMALDSFNLVIADAGQLHQMSAVELSTIKNSVSEGLGLITLLDTIPGSKTFGNPSLITTKIPAQTKIHYFNMQTRLPAEQQIAINPRAGEQTLVSGVKAQILANRKLFGSGKIITNTINNTYSWILDGNKNIYASFWSYLIDKAVSGNKNPAYLNPVNYPRVNQLSNLVANSPSVFPKDVPFNEDAVFKNVFSASFWPGETGWQKIGDEDIFIFNKKDWIFTNTPSNYPNEQLSSNNISANHPGSVIDRAEYHHKTIPAIFPLLLFAVCCTFLWLETKML